MDVDESITYEKETVNYKVSWTIKDWTQIFRLLSQTTEGRILSEYNNDLHLCFKIVYVGNNVFIVYFQSKNLIPNTKCDNHCNFSDNGYDAEIIGDIPHYETINTIKWNYLLTCKIPVNAGDDAGNFIFTIFFTTMRNQLSDDFENLLGSHLHSDITLISVDDVKFNAHKVILSSRSDVFRGCFEHGTVECDKNYVLDSPLESVQLKEVLKYIYSGKIDDVQDATKLLAAADYYNLNELKEKCADMIIKRLSVENAIEFIKLADTYSCHTLEVAVLEFIKNKESDVIETEGFSQLGDAILCKKILKNAFKRNKMIS